MRNNYKSNPKLSVIIPTYNRENYIKSSIDSVLGQTFQDFEIIVVDDESSDKTRDIIRPISDPRLRYIQIKHSGFPSVVRNRGLIEAKGEYISFLDSDDILFPNALKRLSQYLDLHKDVGMVYSNFKPIGDIPTDFYIKLSKNKKMKKTGYVFRDLLLINFILCLGVLIRKSCIETVGRFDENLRVMEDYELFLRIANKYEIHYIDETLSGFRSHKDHISDISGDEAAINYFKAIRAINSKIHMPLYLRRKTESIYHLKLGKEYLKKGKKEYKREFISAFMKYPFNFKSFFSILLVILGMKYAKSILDKVNA